MNEIAEEARPLASGGTEAMHERVITGVSLSEDKSIVYCPTCGQPLIRGSFNRWKMQWSYWCLNEDCADHMSPVRVQV